MLYAGADHPTPAGFLLLFPLVFVCAVAVHLRLPTYAQWSSSKSRNRIARALLDGLIAGLVIGLIAALIPADGKPSFMDQGTANMLIWLAVLAAVGGTNSLLLYGLARTIQKCGHPTVDTQ